MRDSMRALASLALGAVVASAGIAGQTSAALAGDSGDRTLVASTQLQDRPFRSLVLVTVGERVVCTGFVIAPTKVVTAGHCLARDAANGDYRFRRGLPGDVRLHRAYSQIAGGSPFASCEVSKAWAHPRFIRRDAADTAYGSRTHDYAVLTTSPDCLYPDSAVMRLWPTESSDGQLPAGSRIKLGGYPADPRFADMNGLNLWQRGRGQAAGERRRSAGHDGVRGARHERWSHLGDLRQGVALRSWSVRRGHPDRVRGERPGPLQAR
jgi:V8-like Glu-specific endopeptidase